MSLRQLSIYETAHGADSVERHLQELQQWDISPGFIGLELPAYGDSLEFRDLLRWSPATAVALYITVKIQVLLMSRGASNASRGDAEYEAGRQFGELIGASVQNVDRSRDAVFRDYLTWRRRFLDGLLMIGFIVCGLLTFLALIVVLIGLPQSGISIGTIGSAFGFLLIGFVFGLFSLNFLTRIVTAFREGIRDARDDKMFSAALEWGTEQGNEHALIIAGKAHSIGLKQRAEDRGIGVEVRSAPSVKDIDGNSFGLREAKRVYLED